MEGTHGTHDMERMTTRRRKGDKPKRGKGTSHKSATKNDKRSGAEKLRLKWNAWRDA